MRTSMLQLSNSRAYGITGVLAALVSVSAAGAADPIYSVISPLGETTVKMKEMGPRLDTLSNKTVCMVSNSAFKVDVTMPVIAKELQQKFPGLKVVPYTGMATAYSGADYDAKAGEYKRKGCTAVITGNGG